MKNKLGLFLALLIGCLVTPSYASCSGTCVIYASGSYASIASFPIAGDSDYDTRWACYQQAPNYGSDSWAVDGLVCD